MGGKPGRTTPSPPRPAPKAPAPHTRTPRSGGNSAPPERLEHVLVVHARERRGVVKEHHRWQCARPPAWRIIVTIPCMLLQLSAKEEPSLTREGVFCDMRSQDPVHGGLDRVAVRVHYSERPRLRRKAPCPGALPLPRPLPWDREAMRNGVAIEEHEQQVCPCRQAGKEPRAGPESIRPWNCVQPPCQRLLHVPSQAANAALGIGSKTGIQWSLSAPTKPMPPSP